MRNELLVPAFFTGCNTDFAKAAEQFYNGYEPTGYTAMYTTMLINIVQLSMTEYDPVALYYSFICCWILSFTVSGQSMLINAGIVQLLLRALNNKLV